MSDITIWHNPRCSKSRETLALLKDKGVEPTVREYLKEPPSKAEVEKLIEMVGGDPAAHLRALYGALGLAVPPELHHAPDHLALELTFYGLLLLKKEIPAEVSPLGNPAMPMKMPFGPKWFQNFVWPMPNLIMAGIPGFEKVATGLMKMTFKNKGVATVEELRDLCIEADVKMYACQMTVDVFGFSHDEFIGGIDYVGAASFLPMGKEADVCLFI